MPDTREFISVGIDIGTTTTQVVFSRLHLTQTARAGQIPRVEISEREVLYQSEIVFTPLVDSDTIDADTLAAMLRLEYNRAGIPVNQVETGAVIITGETARKKNAEAILSAVAGLAGDFVVTVAGPSLEGIIAGRGSGAAAFSRQHFNTVTNVDIGGGSANAAIFRNGGVIASAAMNFGGRVIELDPQSGKILHITPAGMKICQSAQVAPAVGQEPSLAELRAVTRVMADLALELMEGRTSQLASSLYQTPPLPVPSTGRPVMFSGGIGYYFYNPAPCNSLLEIARHGDIGPLLAESLRAHPNIAAYHSILPAETQRATVLGASSQTMTLSGSTIWARADLLPLHNLPVVRVVSDPAQTDPSLIARSISAALQSMDITPGSDLFALSLELDARLDYPSLTRVAAGLADLYRGFSLDHPAIIVLEKDLAQAVGQTLQGLLSDRPVLVIDQVGMSEGDYIDIGAPLMDGRVVPLVVKTLVFFH